MQFWARWSARACFATSAAGSPSPITNTSKKPRATATRCSAVRSTASIIRTALRPNSISTEHHTGHRPGHRSKSDGEAEASPSLLHRGALPRHLSTMNPDLADTIALLTRTPAALNALLRDLPESWTHRNEGEHTWSPYEVIGHLIQGEHT